MSELHSIPHSEKDPRVRFYPIDHPLFTYPKAKNPYSEHLKRVRGFAYQEGDTETRRGKWREAFLEIGFTADALANTPLHVEIGCNAGHVIVEQAARNPDRLYIGIDWKFKPIFRAAEKAMKRGLKNLIFLRAHADRIGAIFGELEIDTLALYFPDPWAKKSQLKNRWFQARRLEQVQKLMRTSESRFHVKTDHSGYFQWMLDEIEKTKHHWQIEELTWNLHHAHPDPRSLKIPEITLFEGLFIRDEIPIKSLVLSPKPRS